MAWLQVKLSFFQGNQNTNSACYFAQHTQISEIGEYKRRYSTSNGLSTIKSTPKYVDLSPQNLSEKNI